ncbi:MAG TPA: DJ-1/PfpI family protein [Candidatus Hydrogenedentes bacterium]|jgi:4-methyl-5(b-hydroxyethyl)-thiazole monophosphate biosynthesis|nr:DJ-1/PfpI family protein [Candidatus Hydrogenedentota bacterium]HOH43585.1 DJ-1/PfpI family protein [Candidatus Hydrogenedentota bacterium]
MSVVLVPLAPGCEELEAVTVIDIMRRGGLQVISAGLNQTVVSASRGVVLQADQLLEEAILNEEVSVVVLPGGMGGTRALMNAPFFTGWLKKRALEGMPVAAICAAPLILDQERLLSGKRYTAYPGVLDVALSENACYTGTVLEADGNIITSRGPGTAMEFALYLVELLAGKARRAEVEAGLVR